MSRFDRIQNLMKTPLTTLETRGRKLMDELRTRPRVEAARARLDALVEKVPADVRAPLEEDTLTFDAVRRAASAAGEALGAALRGAEAAPETDAVVDADAAPGDEASVEEEMGGEAADAEPAATSPEPGDVVDAVVEQSAAPAAKPARRRRRKPAAAATGDASPADAPTDEAEAGSTDSAAQEPVKKPARRRRHTPATEAAKAAAQTTEAAAADEVFAPKKSRRRRKTVSANIETRAYSVNTPGARRG